MTPSQFLSLVAALLLSPMALASAANAAPTGIVGNVAAGELVFHLCVDCHAVGAHAQAGFAPQLTGVIGRKAGTTKDYKYSDAMKNSGIVWTPTTLRAYLKSPSALVPGTKMGFYGLSDEKKIADLLAYLGSFKAEP